MLQFGADPVPPKIEIAKRRKIVRSYNFQDLHISSITATTQNKKKTEECARRKLVKLRLSNEMFSMIKHVLKHSHGHSCEKGLIFD